MTVLRSRKVLSSVSPKASQPIGLDNGVIQPVTPSKTLEDSNHLENCITPISSSFAPNSVYSELGLRSGGVMETGNVRRRSVRLARKLGIREYADTIEVKSGKRKKAEDERNSNSSEVDGKNMETIVLGLDFEVWKSETAHNSSMVVEKNLRDGDGDGDAHHMMSDKEEVKCCDSASESGSDYDVGSLGMENMNNGKQNTKLSKEIKLLGLRSGGTSEFEKDALNLRSGNRVVKRKMEGDNGSAGSWSDKLESRKDSEIMLTGDVLVKNKSVANIEDENGSRKEMRLSRADNGKGKVGFKTLVISGSASGNLEVDDGETISSARVAPSMKDRRRPSKEEKGKMKYEDRDNSIMNQDVKIENTNSTVSSSIDSAVRVEMQGAVQVSQADDSVNDARRVHMERHRKVARRVASRFAHFSLQDELGNHSPDVSDREIPLPEASGKREDWPGPFSTAMKIINDRESNKKGERHITSTYKSEAAELKWIPVKKQQCIHPQQLVPSLQELCLSILSKNADSITSLDCVPDMLRHKICWFLCDCRRMTGDFLELLVHGSPTEIRVRDCSWLSEELYTKAFKCCSTDKLTVLQLDQCGACMPDYILSATLTRSPNSLPALTTISLKGAYRLTDDGLRMLALSAPNLKSVDLGQCSMLTSDGINCLANSLRLVLKELYIDNCHGIDAMLILQALLKLENLEVLAVGGIHTVSDDFIRKVVSVHGCRMKEIIVADCTELTDSSLEAIGDSCSGLKALDLSNLCKMTDVGICHLANGCQEIQMLKFCHNELSDEAIAAYLDVRGALLKQLSLNNIIKVSNNTAQSLARNCRNLRSLDLSWCRNLTNEALGLIVDTCSLLELLKLFGCTQITKVFLDGYSNPQVKIIGLKLTSVFQHISVPDFLQGPLRYSSTTS